VRDLPRCSQGLYNSATRKTRGADSSALPQTDRSMTQKSWLGLGMAYRCSGGFLTRENVSASLFVPKSRKPQHRDQGREKYRTVELTKHQQGSILDLSATWSCGFSLLRFRRRRLRGKVSLVFETFRTPWKLPNHDFGRLR
jgi:hypothetical protein